VINFHSRTPNPVHVALAGDLTPSVPAHSVVTDYNDFMSGVDSNDKSIALWTVSLKSLRFYLRIFYWQFDSIINAMWILVCHTLSEMNERERKQDKWRQFSSKDSGRYDFTMSLGVSLIKSGLEMDWEGPTTDIKGRPAYTRKMSLVPCQCDGVLCFFCEYGHTHGIDHMKKGQKRRTQTKRLTATHGHTSGRKEILSYASYCRVCYAKARKKFPQKTKHEIRRCNYTKMGCPGCNNGNGFSVCKDCWEHYDHSA